MAEVGTYYITVMPEMSKFTGGVTEALQAAGQTGGKKYSTSFTDVLKGSALGTALGNLASTAGSSIMSGLRTGIGRLDTIQNFPKVMKSLGYETKDAEGAIKLIMERLDGLPTATQDVVTLTQAIADSTGDLDLATKAALGFNDMMLANGASAAEVTQAQGVLNRVLGKGNATVAQWQSLQSVMPAQLAAVARELGGEGMSVEELRDKLNDGTISWNDFLQAIVKLDTEGSGAMASFEEQARANSKGIGTALENVQNRIGQGWAEILGAIGREDIAGAIDAASYGVRDAMKRVGDAIAYVKDLVADTDIADSLKRLGDAIGGVFSDMWTENDTQGVKDMAKAMVDLVDGALKWLADHGQAVGVALSTIGGALFGIFAGQWITSLPAAIAGVQAFWAAMMANPFVLIVGAIVGVIMGLYTFFTATEEGKAIWQGFCDIFTQLVADIQEDWAEFCEVCSREWESFQAFIDGIPEWWQGVIDYWKNALDEQAENFRLAWEKIKADFAQAWEDINTYLNEKTQAISDAIVTFGDNLQAALESVWNYITTAASNAWNTITTTVSNAATNIYNWVVEKLTALRDGAAAIWDSFKATAHNTWENIKTTAVTLADNMRTAIVEKVQAAKDKALEIFDNIKNGIRDKIQWAKDQVSHIIDGIKNLFNFSWSLPAPKLPHIDWHWEDIGGILSVPSFDGISWYAKGGVFDQATLIGIGEKGREAALPLNRQTYTEIARGVEAEMENKGYGAVVIEKLADTLIVREEADIDRIAEAVSRMVARERGSAT